MQHNAVSLIFTHEEGLYLTGDTEGLRPKLRKWHPIHRGEPFGEKWHWIGAQSRLVRSQTEDRLRQVADIHLVKWAHQLASVSGRCVTISRDNPQYQYLDTLGTACPAADGKGEGPWVPTEHGGNQSRLRLTYSDKTGLIVQGDVDNGFPDNRAGIRQWTPKDGPLTTFGQSWVYSGQGVPAFKRRGTQGLVNKVSQQNMLRWARELVDATGAHVTAEIYKARSFSPTTLGDLAPPRQEVETDFNLTLIIDYDEGMWVEGDVHDLSEGIKDWSPPWKTRTTPLGIAWKWDISGTRLKRTGTKWLSRRLTQKQMDVWGRQLTASTGAIVTVKHEGPDSTDLITAGVYHPPQSGDEQPIELAVMQAQMAMFDAMVAFEAMVGGV